MNHASNAFLKLKNNCVIWLAYLDTVGFKVFNFFPQLIQIKVRWLDKQSLIHSRRTYVWNISKIIDRYRELRRRWPTSWSQEAVRLRRRQHTKFAFDGVSIGFIHNSTLDETWAVRFEMGQFETFQIVRAGFAIRIMPIRRPFKS